MISHRLNRVMTRKRRDFVQSPFAIGLLLLLAGLLGCGQSRSRDQRSEQSEVVGPSNTNAEPDPAPQLPVAMSCRSADGSECSEYDLAGTYTGMIGIESIQYLCTGAGGSWQAERCATLGRQAECIRPSGYRTFLMTTASESAVETERMLCSRTNGVFRML